MAQSDVKSRDAARATPNPTRLGTVPRTAGWDLVALAGYGCLTRVYRARPVGPSVNRTAAYALKMLRPEWDLVPQAVNLLRREALVGREVAHPHLIAILAASVDRPPFFVVMPWLVGKSLDRRLATEGPPDPPVALWTVRQVAEALGALHTAGWMHGDVKPANIFTSPEGHVTLLDLGFARRADETGSAVDRCVTGTCQYIAPEMITSRLRADIRSDIYSLGVVLYQMLAGRLPFEGRELAELAAQHAQTRAPDLRRLAPELPSGVIHLVHEMVAKEPLRRPQTPAELIDRLIRLEIETFAERATEQR